MKIFNKYLFISSIFILVFIVIAIALKIEVRSFALYEANSKLNRVLTNQQALHGYIENQLKPVIYTLQDEEKLYKEFFNPKVLSFTYIARSIYQIENELYKEQNKPGLFYKLAAKNPRNELNQANIFEEELIERFNQDKNLTEYKDIIEQNNEKFLYFAKPVSRNKQSCLRCHSDPQIAPKELLQRYGSLRGFHEKLGDIRAIVSIKIPLSSELKYGDTYYQKLLAIIFFALLLVYLIIIYLLIRLDKKNKRLYINSTIDQLTNMYNRRVFDTDIYGAIVEAKREKEKLVLLMLDIDYFKKINDKYGHQVGDEVLIQVSKIIQESMREYDKVYRIGGEEFMIVLKKIDNQEALELAHRVKNEIKNFYIHDKAITVSLGVCQYNNQDDVMQFYKKVDDALYIAKNSGRNTVKEYKKD